MDKKMMSWPALLICPSIAFGNLLITYALVTPSCATQQRIWLHGITTGSIVISLVLTAMAWLAWRKIPSQDIAGSSADKQFSRQRFVARLSIWSGLFFTLTITGQWLAQWILSPCA
jgi:hypothetical protein